MKRKELFNKMFNDVDGNSVKVSYYKITGSADGPILSLLAGQHGMEHSGPNILHQFVKDIDPNSFKGTIYVCPCANPLALKMDYEIYPEGHDISKIKDYYYSRFRHNYCVFNMGRDDANSMYNMNRLWNRQESYGLAGDIADWLWDEMVINADLLIDMHCFQGKKPLIFNSHEKNNQWAKCFGAEAIHMCNPMPPDYQAHSLIYQHSLIPGKYGFCVEFSKQHGLKQREYAMGLKGIDNTMKALKMKEGEIIHKQPVFIVNYETPQPIRATSNGHVRYMEETYAEVRKGQTLYEIWDSQTLETMETGIAPIDGIVGGLNYKPVIAPGDMVCWVAPADKVVASGESIEKPQL